MDMQMKYTLECIQYDGCYFTGMATENGTPEMCNNIDKAVLYDTIPDANYARDSFRCPVDFQVREIILTRKAGQIVD